MKCENARLDMDSYADGELSAWRRFVVQRHLDACPACAGRAAEARSLQQRIRAEAPRFTAPERLRASVMALSGGPAARAATRPPRDLRWQWIGAGALVGCVLTVVSWVVGTAALDRATETDLASAAVAAHVRAVLADQMIQVASSDQHTVKPWLSSHLDYSPPVQDLADEGFALVGARIESLDGRPVATLVYRYRQHTVDVFVRPDWLRSRMMDPRTIRGFHVLRAEGGGMDWLAVSDASAEAIAPLLRRLSE
jgi:anti-sigma factor RsiW